MATRLNVEMLTETPVEGFGKKKCQRAQDSSRGLKGFGSFLIAYFAKKKLTSFHCSIMIFFSGYFKFNSEDIAFPLSQPNSFSDLGETGQEFSFPDYFW